MRYVLCTPTEPHTCPAHDETLGPSPGAPGHQHRQHHGPQVVAMVEGESPESHYRSRTGYSGAVTYQELTPGQMLAADGTPLTPV